MNNQSAFPHESHIQLNTGMTLRDYFAAKAIRWDDTKSYEEDAANAYRYADAMMKAREA